MSNEKKADYVVGRGKTPEHTRYKKGKSGNPYGRPRNTARSSPSSADLMRVLVVVEDRGKKVRMTRKQVGIRKRVEAAAQGDLRSVKELVKLYGAKEMSNIEPPRHLYLSLEESAATGNLPSVDLNSNRIVVVRLPDPAKAAVRPKTVKKPKKRWRGPADMTFRELVDLELDRKIRVTVPSTGKAKRMSLREIIATKLSNAFAAGTKGADDLLTAFAALNEPEGPDYRLRVLIPHDFEIPPPPPKGMNGWPGEGTPGWRWTPELAAQVAASRAPAGRA